MLLLNILQPDSIAGQGQSHLRTALLHTYRVRSPRSHRLGSLSIDGREAVNRIRVSKIIAVTHHCGMAQMSRDLHLFFELVLQ